MKILFDTSVLVAAIVESHPFHVRAFPWLKRAKLQEFNMLIASHAVAELYAVLTTLPVTPKIMPGVASHLISNNIQSIADVISLSSSDYFSIIRRISDLGLSGGIIYDALIVKAAQKSGVDRILTFNAYDFKRILPEGIPQITIP